MGYNPMYCTFIENKGEKKSLLSTNVTFFLLFFLALEMLNPSY